MAGSVRRIRIVLDPDAVHSVPISLAAPHVAETTRRVLTRAKILTPVDTGNLRASQKMRMVARRRSVAGTVETKVRYALAVHDGTRAHIIRPRRRQALKFSIDGQVVFRRLVHHPGTRGRPWLWRALDEVAPARGYQTRRYRAAGGAG